MDYKQSILQELKKVYGDQIPKYVACNPYGGGTSYYDDDNEYRDSGFFGFDNIEELDDFLRLNKHCYSLKEGDKIY